MRRIVAPAALLTSLFFLSMIGLATTTAAPQHDQQLANDHLGQLCKRADRNSDDLPPLHLAHPASSALNHESPSDRYFEHEMEEEKPEGEGKLQKLLPGIGGSGSEGWGTRRKRTPTTISNQPSSSGPSSTASSSSSSSSSDCSPPSSPMGISGAQESRRASQKGKGLRGCRKAKENFEHITRFVEESCSGLKSSKKKKKKRGGITVYKLMAEDPGIPQEHKLTEKQYEYRRSKIKKAIDSIKEINPREDSTNAEIEMCLKILQPWDKTEMDRWDNYFACRKRHRMRGRTKYAEDARGVNKNVLTRIGFHNLMTKNAMNKYSLNRNTMNKYSLNRSTMNMNKNVSREGQRVGQEGERHNVDAEKLKEAHDQS
ncbi:hypothetical protein FA10DRAFT_295472 [Acaromyces ingoldii]|uniref:Uncharacterized protein n=1 Tax=Acaromyces ingoldii TaxID=215250 RepID=A0A316YKQ5_9BASI|nr:hypothetical protein FA10DRAFT_295472 [Acaromyces ingoldii]PWN89656.1 hypothetical protein FA10DRAFT_295472 [Acaromyces ingoldii]